MKTLLLSPLQLRGLELKNRIVVSPMCQYSAEDGFANDWHFVHYGSRAVGGAGLIIAEATAVSPEGRISPYDLGMWKNEHVEKWKQINHFIHQQGGLSGIQLAHAGRKASTGCLWREGDVYLFPDKGGWQPLAPSSIPFETGAPVPLEMDAELIEWVVEEFRKSAQRSNEAGFDVVEIHAAHGYLLHQFLSPITNKRTDKYGGSFDNRVRLLLEVVDAVRQVWPVSKPLFVRISATDWAEGGWDEAQSVKLAILLKNRGVDLMDISSGGLLPDAKVQIGYGYQVSFAAKIKQEAGMKTGAVGLITKAEQAETILTNGLADIILVAREFLRDPYFPLHAATQLKDDISWPVQYERAKPH
ncbi:MAG: NADPH dehydrogenase NamA [Bacteroidota bacterium]|nr:NADPH dehydrogenase NamA [Bacteroidota bacterium]